MSNKLIAAGSVALIGAGSFLVAAPASAYTVDDCGTFDGLDVELLDNNVCSVWSDVAGDYEFTAPDNAKTLEAVIVGAGGGSILQNSVGYAGGGGEVIFVDDLDEAATHSVVVGLGYSESDGDDSSVDDFVANGGESGATGTSGSGYQSAWADGVDETNGGGAAGDATAYTPGPGYEINDPVLVGADNPLWADPQEFGEVGFGGYGTQFDTHGTSGSGGSYVQTGDNTWAGSGGEDGMVVFRFELAEDLAATGVDANGIGMTAGVLGLSGVALGVVAAVRRSRRAK